MIEDVRPIALLGSLAINAAILIVLGQLAHRGPPPRRQRAVIVDVIVVPPAARPMSTDARSTGAGGSTEGGRAGGISMADNRSGAVVEYVASAARNVAKPAPNAARDVAKPAPNAARDVAKPAPSAVRDVAKPAPNAARDATKPTRDDANIARDAANSSREDVAMAARDVAMAPRDVIGPDSPWADLSIRVEDDIDSSSPTGTGTGTGTGVGSGAGGGAGTAGFGLGTGFAFATNTRDIPRPPPPPPPSRARPAKLIYPSRNLDVEDETHLFIAVVTVDTDGSVVGARFVKTGPGSRGAHAANAIWSFRYLPALDDAGSPIRSTFEQEFQIR